MYKDIRLTTEEWDRVVEIIDGARHPDSNLLNTRISSQLLFNPADLPEVHTTTVRIDLRQ